MEFTILQAPDRPRGSGSAYADGLAGGLREAGHRCTVTTGTEWPSGSVPIVDGLALAGLSAQQAGEAIGLIHHPTPLAATNERQTRQERERAALPLLRHVVASSRAVADRLRSEFGVEADRITVVPPGAPAVPRSTGSAGPLVRILSVGDLVPRKGHAMLLGALARLFDLHWHVTIVGDDGRDPVCAQALREQATGMPGRVTLAGSLPAAALDALWQSADLFALTTEWEGYAAPVAEALRRGLPVAVTSGGGAAELVTPETGIVCPPGDEVGFSKAIRRLLFDSALRADMAEAAWRSGRALPGWPEQAARFLEAIAPCC